MKMRTKAGIFLLAVGMVFTLTACGGNSKQGNTIVEPTAQVERLESGLSTVSYNGDYGFDAFLNAGGASSDREVISFLTQNVLRGVNGLSFGEAPFGCSTISVNSPDGDSLFGRNFDWNNTDAMIVKSTPAGGYRSISTVNLGFIRLGGGIDFSGLSDEIQAIVAMYAPLDGMNEQGLAVSVNMIQDSDTIEQNTEKPDITTTTAIRMLLNQAANVNEAVRLLEEYDMHASMGYMIHFAIADADGNSIAVEYVDNEMIVVDTPVVTNFYLAEGHKQGIGSAQSHTRYEILTDRLAAAPEMDMEAVRDALDSVSKDNFGEFESTEWSIVFNQTSGEVHYYHRENYQTRYIFQLN